MWLQILFPNPLLVFTHSSMAAERFWELMLNAQLLHILEHKWQTPPQQRDTEPDPDRLPTQQHDEVWISCATDKFPLCRRSMCDTLQPRMVNSDWLWQTCTAYTRLSSLVPRVCLIVQLELDTQLHAGKITQHCISSRNQMSFNNKGG